MDCYHPQSLWKKKFKNFPTSRTIMIIVFWNCEVILVDVMPRGETSKFDAYIRTLKELRRHFKCVQPHKNPTESCFIMTVQSHTQV
jgi:hypothetical protein